MLQLIFLLLAGHALADYALQSDWMAKNKSRYVSSEHWFYVLSAHALIHGGAVYLITGRLWMGLAETVLHWVIDFAKCEGRTDIHQDQFLHVLCKCLWATILSLMLP